MNEPPVMPNLFCPRCGAANPPYARQCWLCSTSDRTATACEPVELVAITSIADNPTGLLAHARSQRICAVLLIACVVLTMLVGIGIAVQDPGVLIAFVIVVTPAYLATGVRALRSLGKDEPPKASTLLLTFLLSGLFTVLAVVVLAVASFVAFFVWCLTQLS